MGLANERRVSFEAIKFQKSQEVVEILELFGGQISLTEILETPIPILESLQKAKIQLIQSKKPQQTVPIQRLTE
jgi:hypothetical protein